MKRLVYAEDVNSITLDDSIGAFLVPSEMGKHNYRVYFKAPQDNDIPSCECLDWQRNYLPCKHLLGIIQDKKYDTWGWETLPIAYRESPFLSLDMDILCKPIHHILDEANDTQQSSDAQTDFRDNDGETVKVTTTQTTTADLPKPVFPKRTAVTRCCDLLSRIKNLIYECTDSTSLANLEKNLASALQELEDNSNTDAGLTLTARDMSCSSLKCKKRKSKKSTNGSPKKKPRLTKLLSVKPKKKHPSNRRVGERAAMMRKFFKTAMSLEKIETTQPSKNDKSIPDQPSTHYTSFTPIIRAGSSITEKLLRNGPHFVSLLEVKSLEPFLPRGTQILLSSVNEKPFIPGWLYDEVINSFFWCLQKEYVNVLYAASTSILSLQNGGQAGRLWLEKSNEKNQFIIAPWNPTDYHWTFVAIDLQNKNIFYVDPLNSAAEIQNSTYMQVLEKFLPSLLERKFGLSEFQITSTPHTLQTDSSSCGVLVCWYASQFVQGKSMSDSCDTYAMRVRI